MVYTYTPTYYSSLHDSITSLCKNILPFSFKKRKFLAAENKLSKLQSDNLKWQQDSYHQILNLIGLHKEGILAESEVSAFRTHLLDTLIASPPEHEQPVILRDKLLFLQELLYAKCISEDEYHSSKRPLLQRLAVQGAEIETRNVIISGQKSLKENPEDEWSVIDLKDHEKKENTPTKNRLKPTSAIKQIKGAASAFGFGSSKHKDDRSIFEIEAKFSSQIAVNNETETKSILMQESLANESRKETTTGSTEKAKRKPFKTLFQKDHNDCAVNDNNGEERVSKSAKKQWGFDGFKKWKKSDSEDETAPLPLNTERSDSPVSCNLVNSPIGEGPDIKLIKKKLHSDGSASDFFIDKVLGDKIKKELSRIQTELCTTNPNLKFSDDQMDAISTKLPVDKADLKQFFPKSWCERYGDVVLDVVKKEFKEHVGEMENMKNAAREKHINNSKRWTTFEDDDDVDENCHPNLFSHHDYSESNGNKQKEAPEYQNPFWSPRHAV
ncbi:uncharacterized protein [Euphorbia lathyris]|uniref:uncharacterized protein n=1 Tax=Euphorbia lathyris TaxID=212925 RepID=UPI00331391EF